MCIEFRAVHGGYRLQCIEHAHVFRNVKSVVGLAFFSDERLAIRLIVRDRVNVNIAAHRCLAFVGVKATLLRRPSTDFQNGMHSFDRIRSASISARRSRAGAVTKQATGFPCRHCRDHRRAPCYGAPACRSGRAFPEKKPAGVTPSASPCDCRLDVRFHRDRT